MKSFAFTSVLLWKCSNIELCAAQPLQECSNSLEQLTTAAPLLVDAAKFMQNKYNETCHDEGTCTVEATNSIPTSTRDFTNLISEMYPEMSTSCGAVNPGKDDKVCLVTNTVSDNDLKLVELYKPVCFPADCSETEANIRLVDPTPGNCKPNNPNCEILSSEILCPVDRVPTDTGTCQSDAAQIVKNSEVKSSTQKLTSKMVRACIGSLLGTSSELCSVSTTVEAIRTSDYSNFVKNNHESYLAYEEICNDGGGRSCTISTTLINRESESFLSLNSYFVYTDYPVCLPYDECVTDGVSEEDLALEIFKDSFRCTTVGTCEQIVSNISCKDGETSTTTTSPPSPRSSPIPTTSAPTRSPSIASSHRPSASISGPLSSLPSSFQAAVTKEPTAAITEKPSAAITGKPTVTITENPSATITEKPTVTMAPNVKEKPTVTTNTDFTATTLTEKPFSTDTINKNVLPISSDGPFIAISWTWLVATICSLSWSIL